MLKKLEALAAWHRTQQIPDIMSERSSSEPHLCASHEGPMFMETRDLDLLAMILHIH